MCKIVAFLQFLLQEAGVRPNMFVCQNLLTNCFLNFAYKTLICDKMKQFRILPDRKFIARMEESLETAERFISGSFISNENFVAKFYFEFIVIHFSAV